MIVVHIAVNYWGYNPLSPQSTASNGAVDCLKIRQEKEGEAGRHKILVEMLAYLNLNRYFCSYTLWASHLARHLRDIYELSTAPSNSLLSSS